MNNSSSAAAVKEPLFHISRRTSTPLWQAILIRAVAVIIGLTVCGIIFSASSSDKGFFDVFASIFKGCFGTERRTMEFFMNMALLLGVSLALVVAFKMKFWNLGGNGQILMGCLASAMCLHYFSGTSVPQAVIWIVMIVSSVLAGAIWAIIPAVFRAYFRTNESLFTLMMNYIALYLVKFVIEYWDPLHGVMNRTDTVDYVLSSVKPNGSLITIILVAIITVFMVFYLKRSKHGYEISVVGDSENTALYAGINVKKVMIRTLAISGALCGVIGLLLTGMINHSVTTDMDGNMGFTGIMVAWLAHFNPYMMILTAFFISFVSVGINKARLEFGFTSDEIGDVIIGIIYFLIIACEFFIAYKVTFRKNKNGEDYAVIAFFKGLPAKVKSLFKGKKSQGETNDGEDEAK